MIHVVHNSKPVNIDAESPQQLRHRAKSINNTAYLHIQIEYVNQRLNIFKWGNIRKEHLVTCDHDE